MSEGERRLAAIMFTDIVGFTSLAQANESRSLELLEEHRNLLRPLFPAHGGAEIKTIGDAFLVEFKSALEAVKCAVAAQEKMRQRNSAVPSSRRLEVRVGIHLGDVVHSSGDVYGDAVNVASRIEPLAEPGGVCISQQVFDNVRNKTELDIAKVGEVELKNVELPMGVYKITMPWNQQTSEASSAPRERLAVLPFVNISPDPNDEYFADGLTEELITKLSEVGGLKVIARTSVMNYKRKEKNVSQIGKELSVGSVIEGSVRKAGNRIRVTVQLIDAHTEEHLWVNNYDSNLDDIFAIQSDVASKIAKSISSGVLSKEVRKDTSDIEAYTLYIRAVQLCHEGTEQSLRQAISLLGRAISRDPGFARAYAWLSNAWDILASGGYEGWEVVPGIAQQMARKGLELGPEWAETHAAMAIIHGGLDRFKEAISEAEKAIQINPNLTEAHMNLGVEYCSIGDLNRGLRAFEKAHEIDPLSFLATNFLALVYRSVGRVSEALGLLERMRELNPNTPRVYSAISECYMVDRDFEKAQEAIDAGKRVSANEILLDLDQGLIYAFTGRRNEAEAILGRFEGKRESTKLYAQLFIFAALGNLDGCYNALARMSDLHSWPFLIKSLPIFEDLRKDPRFPEFCVKVGIPPLRRRPFV